jgi:hypothetical protein
VFLNVVIVLTYAAVSIGTINRDLSILIQQAKENIKKYINERLPEEYEKCIWTYDHSKRSLEAII